MKAFNLIATALAGALILTLGVSALADHFLTHDNAILVVAPLALLFGLSARRVTEKILGYSLYEAMKNDTDGN